MNQWGQIKDRVYCEADDFQDKYDRSGLDMLFYWKAKYPNFKITLFTIPNKTSDSFLKLLSPHRDWIELAVHGWDHDSNFECWGWSYEKTHALMERVEKTGAYIKMFKAPGWTITAAHPEDEYKFSGYPVGDPKLPVYDDPQGVFRALHERGYTVVDRHYDKPARPSEDNIICIDCAEDIVHFHTWDMVTGDPNGRNGFRQVEELFGVPWDNNTQFYFLSEGTFQCTNS